MKNFLLILALITGSVSFAQPSLSFHAVKYTTDTESEEYSEINEVFTFSFEDKILCHNVYSGVELSDAQFYKITSVKEIDIDAGSAWQIEVESGVSGSVYIYVLVSLDAGGYVLVQGDYWYLGNAVDCKTFKQK
ncbi:MAG: hypothetical protein ACOVO3_11255 [Fluviicola sp.]|jgi:hypothetical protein